MRKINTLLLIITAIFVLLTMGACDNITDQTVTNTTKTTNTTQKEKKLSSMIKKESEAVKTSETSLPQTFSSKIYHQPLLSSQGQNVYQYFKDGKITGGWQLMNAWSVQEPTNSEMFAIRAYAYAASSNLVVISGGGDTIKSALKDAQAAIELNEKLKPQVTDFFMDIILKQLRIAVVNDQPIVFSEYGFYSPHDKNAKGIIGLVYGKDTLASEWGMEYHMLTNEIMSLATLFSDDYLEIRKSCLVGGSWLELLQNAIKYGKDSGYFLMKWEPELIGLRDTLASKGRYSTALIIQTWIDYANLREGESIGPATLEWISSQLPNAVTTNRLNSLAVATGYFFDWQYAINNNQIPPAIRDGFTTFIEVLTDLLNNNNTDNLIEHFKQAGIYLRTYDAAMSLWNQNQQTEAISIMQFLANKGNHNSKIASETLLNMLFQSGRYDDAREWAANNIENAGIRRAIFILISQNLLIPTVSVNWIDMIRDHTSSFEEQVECIKAYLEINNNSLCSEAVERARHLVITLSKSAGDDTDKLRRIGLIATRNQLYQEAEYIWRTCTTRDADNYEFMNNLAWTLYNQNMIDEALISAERAVKSAPRDASCNVTLSHIHEKLGNLEKSLIYQQEAVKHNPDTIELRLRFAELLLINKQFDAAAQQVEVIDRFNNTSADAAQKNRLFSIRHLIVDHRNELSFKRNIERSLPKNFDGANATRCWVRFNEITEKFPCNYVESLFPDYQSIANQRAGDLIQCIETEMESGMPAVCAVMDAINELLFLENIPGVPSYQNLKKTLHNKSNWCSVNNAGQQIRWYFEPGYFDPYSDDTRNNSYFLTPLSPTQFKDIFGIDNINENGFIFTRRLAHQCAMAIENQFNVKCNIYRSPNFINKSFDDPIEQESEVHQYLSRKRIHDQSLLAAAVTADLREDLSSNLVESVKSDFSSNNSTDVRTVRRPMTNNVMQRPTMIFVSHEPDYVKRGLFYFEEIGDLTFSDKYKKAFKSILLTKEQMDKIGSLLTSASKKEAEWEQQLKTLQRNVKNPEYVVPRGSGNKERGQIKREAVAENQRILNDFLAEKLNWEAETFAQARSILDESQKYIYDKNLKS